jgi:ParB family chromosome partitioning protein
MRSESSVEHHFTPWKEQNMAEKRRGLGRGLGALIPSAPAEEAVIPEATRSVEHPVADEGSRKGGRPVDLFFERVTEEDVIDSPRSYSSALRSGINRNVLDAQTKRAAKSPSSKPTKAVSGKIAKADTDVAEEKLSLQQGQHAGTSESAEAARAPETGERANTTQVDEEPDHSVAAQVAPEENETGLMTVPGAEFAELELDSIHANRKQPRVEFNADELAELVHSIREIGVLQPVVVRPSQEGGEESYELVMGERRWRASREAGLERIPAIIRSTLDDDLLRDALLENLHRSALNPLEEAAAYQQLLDDFGCSHDELAGRLGRSRPQISNTLRLMKLPPLVQRRVAAGVISAGHARALLGLSEASEMEKLAQRIVAEGLSVRSTEEIVALSGGLRRASKPTASRESARHERLDYLATSLSDRLDTNVKITLGAKKGRVSIEFASVDDLNRIVGELTPKNEK